MVIRDLRGAAPAAGPAAAFAAPAGLAAPRAAGRLPSLPAGATRLPARGPGDLQADRSWPLVSASVLAVAAAARRSRRRPSRSGAVERRSAGRLGRAALGAPMAAGQPEPEIDPRRRDPPTSVPPVRMPVVDAEGGKLDVMSMLLKDRIIILGGDVKDEMAQVLIAQMLYLANESSEDITMYINSPGGSVSAGLAIFDTMQFISCDISTVCFGMAASMGSFLLAAGTKGKRKSLPNSRIMIHQPLGGAQGQAADVRIQAREILFMREMLNQHLADCTGQTMEKVKEDCDRDNFMTPEEAMEYGLIDNIVETKSWPRIQKPPRPEL